MAGESFANQEIAALLNRWFVSVKVDREERPDVDQLYMAATKAMYTCFPLLTYSGLNQQWLVRHVECINTLLTQVSGTIFAIVSDGEKCSEPMTTCAAVKEMLLTGQA